MRRTLLVLALASLSVPVLAQAPQVPGAADVSRVTAGSYKVDSDHSHVTFTVNHFGISEFTGQFGQPTGTLTLDPKNPQAASVDISFPVDKVSSNVEALNTHLKSADFFDAARFPTARFVSTGVKVNGTRATITGNLTLRDVTKPVVLEARFVGAGQHPMHKKLNLGFAATTTIKRSDFGISYVIPLVSDEVKLAINVAFEAQ